MAGEKIRKLAAALGAEVCGIAGTDRFIEAPEGFRPTDILPGAKSVVVYGRQFPKSLFAASSNAPYTLFRNKLIDIVDHISIRLSAEMEKEGFMTVPVPSSEPYEYWNPTLRHGRGILSLKHAAQLAGLGFIGKNTLLINGKYGNRLWLGAVISDAPLKSDAQKPGNCPEGCRICRDACPQSALDGTTIEQIKCRAISASQSEGGGFMLTCNLCRKTCPFSRA
ncbi:MAG: epoxyqueuosine reductase [Synergistales bacterium]